VIRRGAIFALLLAALAFPAVASAAKGKSLRVEVLSNRADLISGGDALVAIGVPKKANAAKVKVAIKPQGKRRAKNVSRAFAFRENGRFEGLVEGLQNGKNLLTARYGKRRGKVTIRNRPNGGPVFSGPQVQPWQCQEGAEDAKCNAEPTYRFLYMPTGGGALVEFDPDSPPGNVATTTTDQGKEVPFIVREETGYQARDQYRIAALYDPAQPWEPWDPQAGWNGKVLITHGASCGITHEVGDAPDVLVDYALERGYAVMSTALNNAGHNCNIVTQAESMVMAKERIVEQYGPIRFTIGTGCSGGSLTQQQVANAYPGVYQGILPQCSYPDALSTGAQFADYNLMRHYFEGPEGLAAGWTPTEWAAVEGHLTHANAVAADVAFFKNATNPEGSCVPAEVRYDSETNPGGVRCSILDYMINVFGPRPKRDWSPMEKAAGRGFGAFPLGNVGIQYGLNAMRRGTISVEKFVALNESIGGFDVDLGYVDERVPGYKRALANTYRSGAINSANNLDRVAIIDLRGPDPAIAHDVYRSWALRARIEQQHGTFENHVIWFGATPLLGSLAYAEEAFGVMDEWLAGVEKERTKTLLQTKIIRNRPADLGDRCDTTGGLPPLPGIGDVCELPALQTKYGTPRTVAGEDISTDVNACTLQPLRRTAYYPIEFTDDQWTRMEATFSTGVCDYSKPGIGQQDTIAWQRYDKRGKVVYGGAPMGKAPRRSGAGWTSPAFSSWLSGK
jgi:hypothetical protein